MELSSIRRCFVAHRESNDNTDFPTLYSSLHFNQRTRMGCDTIWCLLPPPKFRFNPRTRMGCDTAKVGELLPVYWFQSTHPHGVRLAKFAKHRNVDLFQSTHPHGVRPSDAVFHTQQRSFNPRTRTGCDNDKGAYVDAKFQFQSTHPHGVRHFEQPLQDEKIEFQSTHPHGVRQASRFSMLCEYEVSIHAPARGATSFCFDFDAKEHGFNPRTRTGCDNLNSRFKFINYVSIHAPARGATLLLKLLSWYPRVSIHAPARGATLLRGVVRL